MTNEAIAITRNFLELLNLIEKEWPNWQDEVRTTELETQDLLHEIEFTRFDASRGYQLSKQIQEARRHRRQMKEQLEALQFLKDFIENNKQLKISLYKVLNSMEKTVEHQGTRMYMPRVRTEVGVIAHCGGGEGGEFNV